MIKKITAATLAIAVSVTLFAGCGKKDKDSSVSSSTPEGKAFTAENVFTINGTEVPTEIYKSIFLSMKNQADIGDSNYWNDKGDEFTDMKNNVEDFLKTFYVPVIFSKQYNISLSDADNKEIDDAIKSIIEQTGGEEAYEEALKTEFLTKEIYYELTKIKALDKRVFTDLYKEGGLFAVSDDVIKEAFKNDYVVVKHILISKDDASEDSSSATDNSSLSGLELAESVLAKAKAGEDFDALIKEYGNDPGMAESPNGYFFTHGDMVPSFEEASYKLKDNEISDIVETDYGYHIIKKIPLETYYSTNFDDVRTTYNLNNYSEITKKAIEDYKIKYTKGYEDIGINSFN